MENVFAGTTISTSRSEFMSRLNLVSGLEASLNAREKKIADAVIYGTKVMGGPSKEIFEAKDTTRDSITNLNNAKLEASQYFLLEKIRVLSAEVEDESDASLASASYDIPADAILNGEIEITVSGKTCLPRTSCRIFDKTGESTDGLAGCYKLANPVLIAPQSLINCTIRVNSAVSDAVKKEAVRVELIGSKIIPA